MTKVIVSKNLGKVWKDEVVIAEPSSEAKFIFIFAEKLPREFDFRLRLAAPHSRAEVIFAWLGRHDQTSQVRLELIHEAPETYGRILAKAALFDQSGLTFRGRIHIQPLAQKSDSFLLMRALSLDKEPRAEIFPYLDIETDDVRASHGASAGGLDSRALFYLKSRGLDQKQAQAILLSDFFADITPSMPHPWPKVFFQNAGQAAL